MQKDKDITCLVGNFSKANVQVAGLLNTPIDSVKFEGSSHHDVGLYRNNPDGIGLVKHTYRFINPEHLSSEALETFKAQPNAHVFDDDLSGSYITLNRNEGVKIEINSALEIGG